MNINDIPKNIVVKFLDDYYPDLLDNNYYVILLDLILSGEIKSAPDEIVNWIIAYNNLNKKNIKNILISNILLNRIDLSELYQTLKVNNKDDLIQILSYLHKLDDDLTVFNNFPIEILKKILLGLDVDSLLLWFKSNKYLNFSSKSHLDNILISKIALVSDMNIDNFNRKQLIILNKIFERGQYYGKYSGIIDHSQWPGTFKNDEFEDDEFRIINKEIKPRGDRNIIRGKLCNNFLHEELIDILWNLGGNLPDDVPFLTEEDRESIINQLLGNEKLILKNKTKTRISTQLIIKKHSYDEMNNWDLKKVIFYYEWMRARNKRLICDAIKTIMIELELIK